jgi:hypothetical protein
VNCINKWSIRGKRNILLIRLPENRFKLSRFGKVNVLKKIDMNSIKNNNNKKYSFWKMKLYIKIVENII